MRIYKNECNHYLINYDYNCILIFDNDIVNLTYKWTDLKDLIEITNYYEKQLILRRLNG